jgi:hypothetical protein
VGIIFLIMGVPFIETDERRTLWGKC